MKEKACYKKDSCRCGRGIMGKLETAYNWYISNTASITQSLLASAQKANKNVRFLYWQAFNDEL